MPWSVNISWRPKVNIPGTVGESSVIVVEYPQASHAHDTPVVITDLCVPCLDNTAVVVVIDRDIFDLDHSSVVVVLYVRIVVVTRVKIKVYIVGTDVHIYISSAISTEVNKVELTIREYRKLNGTFNEDIGISIIFIIGWSTCFTGSSLSGKAR
jgi:hypothetical protein